jgi:DNA-binding LacI/PurR family transcriptional regulator
LTYQINVLIDDYTDIALRDKLVLNGVHESAYQKKMAVRTFFSIEALIRALDRESRKFVIVISQSKINSERLLLMLNERGIHPVFINLQFSNTNYFFSSVIPNYYSSVYQLTRMILGEYPENSAFVGYNADSAADKLRLDGFRKAVDEYGLKDDVFSNDGNIDITMDSLLKQINGFKNLICANDVIALLLICRMKGEGLAVEEFNITGYGNIKTGEFFKPSLTTITGDYYNEGIMAVDIYVFLVKKNYLNKNHVHNLSVNMDSRIIFRESTHLKAKNLHNELKPEISGEMINFYGNNSVKEIDALERMLVNCDETDMNILRGLMAGATYEQIAESCCVSVNTRKYRLKKMGANLMVKSRKEIVERIKVYDLDFDSPRRPV